jgi:hypothetical protein
LEKGKRIYNDAVGDKMKKHKLDGRDILFIAGLFAAFLLTGLDLAVFGL